MRSAWVFVSLSIAHNEVVQHATLITTETKSTRARKPNIQHDEKSLEPSPFEVDRPIARGTTYDESWGHEVLVARPGGVPIAHEGLLFVVPQYRRNTDRNDRL
jgi:hypothetical protein